MMMILIMMMIISAEIVGVSSPGRLNCDGRRRVLSSLHICQSSVGRYRASCCPFIASVCMFVHNEMVALDNCSARHTRLKSIFICSLSIRRQLAIDDQCVIEMLLGVTAVGRQDSELPGESRIQVGWTDLLTTDIKG